MATRIDHRLKPVAPVSPGTPTTKPSTKPPTEAHAIPRITVTTKRPGAGPGTIRCASSPAMAPTATQLVSPTIFPPRFGAVPGGRHDVTDESGAYGLDRRLAEIRIFKGDPPVHPELG